MACFRNLCFSHRSVFAPLLENDFDLGWVMTGRRSSVLRAREACRLHRAVVVGVVDRLTRQG